MNEIFDLIRSLGINRTYVGYHHLATAVALVMEDENRLLHINKWLYSDVAKIHHTTPSCVERNIRTVNQHCWEKGNRALLCQIAGRDLTARPSNSEFIDILSGYVKTLSLEEVIS